jgi:DNA-directed RNA polymerase subunit RPC12/RpoP
MKEEMECMCMECGMSSYLPANDVIMEDPASNDSKLLDSLLVCQNCGGRLSLAGKAGDKTFYRLK